MNDLGQLLPKLDPPPGGAGRFAIKLAERDPAPLRWRPAFAAALLIFALLLTALFPRATPESAGISAALQAAAAAADTPIVANGAALELPSTQADVQLFLVVSRD